MANRKFHLATEPRKPFTRVGAFATLYSIIAVSLAMMLAGLGEPAGALLLIIVGCVQLSLSVIFLAIKK